MYSCCEGKNWDSGLSSYDLNLSWHLFVRTNTRTKPWKWTFVRSKTKNKTLKNQILEKN